MSSSLLPPPSLCLLPYSLPLLYVFFPTPSPFSTSSSLLPPPSLCLLPYSLPLLYVFFPTPSPSSPPGSWSIICFLVLGDEVGLVNLWSFDSHITCVYRHLSKSEPKPHPKQVPNPNHTPKQVPNPNHTPKQVPNPNHTLCSAKSKPHPKHTVWSEG